MIDAAMIPDPGLPRADGYYLQHARAALHVQGIATPEQFIARYGMDIRDLTAFGLLYVVDRGRGEREMRLNALYRAGMPKHRTAAHIPELEGNAA